MGSIVETRSRRCKPQGFRTPQSFRSSSKLWGRRKQTRSIQSRFSRILCRLWFSMSTNTWSEAKIHHGAIDWPQLNSKLPVSRYKLICCPSILLPTWKWESRKSYNKTEGLWVPLPPIYPPVNGLLHCTWQRDAQQRGRHVNCECDRTDGTPTTGIDRLGICRNRPDWV